MADPGDGVIPKTNVSGEQIGRLIEKVEQMSCILNDVKSSIVQMDDMSHKFYTEYRVEHVKVADLVASAHKRIDTLELSTRTLTQNMSDLQMAIKPLISANKFLLWLGGGVGVLIIGFLFAILTHQIQIMVP